MVLPHYYYFGKMLSEPNIKTVRLKICFLLKSGIGDKIGMAVMSIMIIHNEESLR